MTSETLLAADVARGVARLLWYRGIAAQQEVTLPDGHRADLLGIARDGTIWCVEIKVSAADLRQDGKWQAYRAYSDHFCWAVPEALAPLLQDSCFAPDACGLIIADRHEACLMRAPLPAPLAPARRRAMTLLLARLGAERLIRLRDPGFEGLSAF
ncbi:MAG: MmcB family DNA repair protein [Thermaurantiacus sp.]